MKTKNTSANIPGQGSARETTILQNLELVNNLANRFKRRVPPCVTFDDLVSAGTIGLVQAVDRFDESRGLQFQSYARHRIQGAMLDFLREEDPLTRAERRRVRESPGALSATWERTQPSTVSLEQAPEASLRCAAAPVGLTLRSEILQARRRCLSAREERVIKLLYDFGWRSREIAADLHVNESRVSQIKRRALAKLRLYLETEG